MKAFSDARGRTWQLDVNIAAIKRVKGLLGIDLLALGEGEPPLMTCLGTDVVLLCDIIFALLKPQADGANVSDEDFGAALGGEAIFAAQEAFYEELTAFFRSLGRQEMATALTAQRKLIATAVMEVEKRIAAVPVEQIVQTAIQEASGSGGPSMNSPGSSA